MRWTGFLIVLIGIVATAGVAVATDGRPRDAVDAELLAHIGNQPLEAFLAGILAPIQFG